MGSLTGHILLCNNNVKIDERYRVLKFEWLKTSEVEM